MIWLWLACFKLYHRGVAFSKVIPLTQLSYLILWDYYPFVIFQSGASRRDFTGCLSKPFRLSKLTLN
jgi:hypothetical protein